MSDDDKKAWLADRAEHLHRMLPLLGSDAARLRCLQDWLGHAWRHGVTEGFERCAKVAEDRFVEDFK